MSARRGRRPRHTPLPLEALRSVLEAGVRDALRRTVRESVAALIRSGVPEGFGLDEQRRTALRVFTAYYARSLTDPALAAVFLHDAPPLEDLVAALIAQVCGAGTGGRPLDPRREADLLVSGVTGLGLGLDLLHGRRTRAEVRQTVDYHLDRLLSWGEVRQAAVHATVD